ncbi:hypothetical protein [Aureibaculum luteum]|uniref:hypothetical protein n=1 Tax=Aureibaculum luteum TaxID=1548456 RepID=UPI000E4B3BE8|nr:hypothetical protein [Aureibaculum luteum]
MKKQTFDYIYDLLYFHDDDIEWWEYEGYEKLRGYLDNLNSNAIETLLGYSETWEPSIRLNLAEALIMTKVEGAFEEYCKVFINMEIIQLAHYMSSKLEYIEPNDLKESLYQKYLDKMVEIVNYEKTEEES